MSLDYYYSQYEKLWGKHKLTRAQDFFLVNSTWGLPVLIVIQLIFILYAGPTWMRSRKPYELRPLMIVLNGLHFGAYGCGVLMLGYGISLGRDCWECEAKELNEFRDDIMLRIAYALFCMRLLEFTTPIIMILRGKKTQSPVANAIYNSFFILIIYHCINRYHQNLVYLYPYTDAMKIAARSAYYSLTSPGAEFRRSTWFKHYVTLFALLLALFNVYHLTYMISNRCDGPGPLMYSFLALASGEIVFYSFKLFEAFTSNKCHNDSPGTKVTLNSENNNKEKSRHQIDSKSD